MKTMSYILSGLALSSIVVVNVLGASLGRTSRFPTTISNCSGDVTPIAPASYFPSYGPKIDGDVGWETWTVPLPHYLNDSMTVFTWTRGDPASPMSNPNDMATFSVFSSRAGFNASVTDKFVYEYVSEKEMHISIGDNHLVFDGNHGVMVGLWNVSVNIEGLQSDISIDIVYPGIPFEPSYNGVRSQVIDGYFSSVLAYRGHAHGPLTFPSGETWAVLEVTSVKHAYAKEPIQNLVSSYTKGVAYVEGSGFSWFKAESVTKSKTADASQLVVGVGEDVAGFLLKYEATGDRSIYNMTTEGMNTTAVFAGCTATQQNPYEFTVFPVVDRGGFVDSAGGKTTYYNVQASSSIWLDQLVVGNGTDSIGVLEVYTSP